MTHPGVNPTLRDSQGSEGVGGTMDLRLRVLTLTHYENMIELQRSEMLRDQMLIIAATIKKA